MLTQLVIHVSKEEGSRGEYTKKRCPGRGKMIDRGLSRALNGAGAWTGAAAGGKKNNSPPRAIDWGRAGDWGSWLPVSGLSSPRNEHYVVWRNPEA